MIELVVDDRRFATRTHQPALDGLRGLAVAGVLLFHGGHLTGGYLGVDAFFVLSGFLITSLLLAEVSTTHRISLLQFWARRARRLLPALGCVLAAVALYAALMAHSNELSTIRGDALATIAYVANWRQIFTSNDYWALFRSPSPLQHTWSLSIEEQFYVVWPLVVVAVTRGRSAADAARRVLVTACVGAGVSFVLMQLTFHAADTSRAYYGTDTRASSILIGAALAAWIALRGPVGAARRKHLETAAIVAAVLLAIAWAHLSGTSALLYRGGLFVCALAVALLIAAGVHPERGPVSKALSWRPLRELGLISYGVYLWHWPIYVVVDADRAHFTGWPLLFVRVVITLAVSIASFRIIERPVRYGARSNRWLLQVTPVVVITLVVAIVASTAGATSNAVAATTTHGGVLVVGDSVAQSLFPGIVRAGFPAEETTQVGCRLLAGKLDDPGVFPGSCPWRAEWHAAVKQQEPDVVLMIIGAWDLFDIRPPGFDHAISPGSPEWDAYYARQLNDAITLLTARGARLLIPTLPCNGGLTGAQNLADRSSFNVARVRAANAVLAQVVARHKTNVSSPDLFGLLCPAGKFQPGLGNVAVVRSDGVHYTDAGAALVTIFLAPSLRAALPGGAGTPSTKLVAVYGDAIMAESLAAIGHALPSSSGVQAETTAQQFAAVCDMIGWLKRDLAAHRRPELVAFESNGADATACMRDAAGKQIVRDSPAFYAKFEHDVVEFFSTAHAAGVPVMVVAPPPPRFRAGIEEQAKLTSILVKTALQYPGTIYSNRARNALGGARWTAALPCLSDEQSQPGCRDGRIAVRSPDGAQLCPTGYASLAAFAAGCTQYSSGAVRFGRAVAAALVAGPTNDNDTHTSGPAPTTTVAPPKP